MTKRSPEQHGDERRLLVLLGAGAGTRFVGDGHKLNAPFGTSTVALSALRSALDSNVGDVAIIVGAVPINGLDPRVTPINNPKWSAGQATSLAAAVDYARRHHYDVVVVALADQPMISPHAWRSVALAERPFAYATYDGIRGHPMRFHRSMWDLLPTTGDEGARSVLRSFDDQGEAVACEGSASDVDTVEDLRKWQNN